MMKPGKNKILETSLVLTTGFLLVFWLTKTEFFLYLSFAFGFIGIFIQPLARLVTILWFKLADVLNYVFSRIILGAIFFLVLFPISLMYRRTNKDKLQLKNTGSTNWFERNKKYSGADLENTW